MALNIFMFQVKPSSKRTFLTIQYKSKSSYYCLSKHPIYSFIALTTFYNYLFNFLLKLKNFVPCFLLKGELFHRTENISAVYHITYHTQYDKQQQLKITFSGIFNASILFSVSWVDCRNLHFKKKTSIPVILMQIPCKSPLRNTDKRN